MFVLKRKEDYFNEYEICDIKNDSSMKIVSERGAMLTSLTLNGREILYLDRKMFENDSTIRAGGFPVLFPICGRLNECGYCIDEKKHMMPTHGFAKLYPWKVQEVDLKNGRIILNFRSNAETKIIYPFDFELEFSYTLKGNELLIEQKYINNGDEDMPFYAGFHPFFNVESKDLLKFSINADRYYFYKNGEEKTGKYDGNIDFNTPVDFVFILNDEREKEYSMIDSKNNGLKISTSEHFKFMVMWTVEGENFVCMEPWMAPPDSMNTKKHLQMVHPGSVVEAWIKVSSV